MNRPSGFWRKCRLAFRCVRFTVWGLVLLLLGALAWFNLVGLPAFIKTRLLAAVEQRGVHLEFTRMRLRFVHGFICDNVRIGAADNHAGPELAAREVQLRLDFPALFHGHAQIDGLVLHHGAFTLPLPDGDTLAATNLEGDFRISHGDTWSLDRLRGNFSGLTITLAGEIEHAPECSNWKIFSAPTSTGAPSGVGPALETLARTLKQIHLGAKAQINVRLDGNARDVHSFKLFANSRLPSLTSPWLVSSNFEFAARVTLPPGDLPPADPAWGMLTNLQPFHIGWLARGSHAAAGLRVADAWECTGTWTGGGPGAFNFTARSDAVHTEFFDSRGLALDLTLGTPAPSAPAADPADGPWTNAWPFQLRWKVHSRVLAAQDIFARDVACSGQWSAPILNVHELSANLDGGPITADGRLNVSTRNLNARVNSGFDLHALTPLLPEAAQEQLRTITWTRPPSLLVTGAVVLPPWTAPAPQWWSRPEAAPQLSGELTLANTRFTDTLALEAFHTHFAYTNQVWNLPDLQFTQGRTALKLALHAAPYRGDFHLALAGALDPADVQTALGTRPETRIFNLLHFKQPLTLDATAAGNWRDFATLSVTGRVAVPDFSVRGQAVDLVTTTASYSNLTAELYAPELVRAGGAEHFSAPRVTIDLAGERIFLHHGTGHVLPMAVARAIGPITASCMEPYQFVDIPDVAVDGCIPVKLNGDDVVTDDADLWFTILKPATFRWRRFETTNIIGNIHWLRNDLILTNVQAVAYSGTARGWAVFDVATPGEGTDFSFFLDGTNADFNAMGRALWSPTNELRGSLSGHVHVTHANSSDWRTWNGYGDAQLQNGLLWDEPVFGLMSPVLNTLTPGLDLGNSRATDATARFNLTNGVIHTDSLKIQSLAMRLDYVGTVDLEENISARVRAQLLRNTPVVGSVFSVLLTPVSKALECDVTGTLDNPKISPAYIPFTKVLTAPLHPFRTVEEMFSSPATNSPAKP